MTAVAFDISTLTAYQRGTYDRIAPIAVECRGCGSKPGAYCKSKSGYNVPFHKVRKDAVSGWPYDERIVAVAELKAEQKRLQEQAAAQSARPLTADRQRTRAAISALVDLAYAEADARLDAERAGAQAAADAFNAKHPVDTPVRYWRGARRGAPSGTGRITHPAGVYSGVRAAVLVGGCVTAVSLSHVEPLTRDDLVRETAAAMVVAL